MEINSQYVFYWISEDTLINMPMDEAVTYWSDKVWHTYSGVIVTFDDFNLLGGVIMNKREYNKLVKKYEKSIDAHYVILNTLKKTNRYGNTAITDIKTYL
jgi:hypothetical protein